MKPQISSKTIGSVLPALKQEREIGGPHGEIGLGEKSKIREIVAAFRHEEPPRITSLPKWLINLIERMYTQTPIAARRAPTLPSGMEVPEALKTGLTELLCLVKWHLRPAADAEWMVHTAFLLVLYRAFYSKEQSAALVKGYRVALGDLPVWAIRRGCENWLRGECGAGTENYAFAPSPPQLHRLVVQHSRPVAEFQYKLDLFVRAKPAP